MNKTAILGFVIAALVAVVASTAPAFAAKPGGGNAASSKAVFSMNNSGTVVFTRVNFTGLCGDTGFDEPSDQLCSPWVKLFDLPDAIKTSATGAISVDLSFECSLWTDSEAAAMIGFGGSGGSRAGIEARVMIDGEEMAPGQVVMCDRMQYVSLTVPLLFVEVPVVTSVDAEGNVTTTQQTFEISSNDPFVVGLFQRTKNAHSFNFYGATGKELHHVEVEVRGIVQCFKDGTSTVCEDSGIDVPKIVGGESGNIEGGTKAAIGKATIVVQEQQNWREMESVP